MSPALPSQELPLKPIIVSALAESVKATTKARDVKIALKGMANLNLTGKLDFGSPFKLQLTMNADNWQALVIPKYCFHYGYMSNTLPQAQAGWNFRVTAVHPGSVTLNHAGLTIVLGT